MSSYAGTSRADLAAILGAATYGVTTIEYLDLAESYGYDLDEALRELREAEARGEARTIRGRWVFVSPSPR